MSAKCYVCEKNDKLIESDLPLYPYENEYYWKSGLFSKNKIIICENCEENIIDLFGSLDWRKGTNHLISKEGKHFIDNNKEKIINRDFGNLPSCPYCLHQSKSLEKIKCNDCSRNYCNRCAGLDIIECPNCLDKKIRNPIKELLKKKAIKMSISDIAAFIKQDRANVKFELEEMYERKEIDFAGNGRYFILNPDKKKSKPKKGSAPKSKAVDVKEELKKYKEMLDNGLIEQEDYDAKKKELLGL